MLLSLRLMLVVGSVVQWCMREGGGGLKLSGVFRSVVLGGLLSQELFDVGCLVGVIVPHCDGLRVQVVMMQ